MPNCVTTPVPEDGAPKQTPAVAPTPAATQPPGLPRSPVPSPPATPPPPSGPEGVSTPAYRQVFSQADEPEPAGAQSDHSPVPGPTRLFVGLDVLTEARDAALAACDRLSRLYECVRWSILDPEDDHVRETGLWLLDVLDGRADDRRPRARDPAALWARTSPLLDVTAAECESALPPLPVFANVATREQQIRRKPMGFAIEAALLAPSLLSDDLAECRREGRNPAGRSGTVSVGRGDGEGRYDWALVCVHLGDRGGGHFERLAEKVKAEYRAAADRFERLHRETATAPPRFVPGPPTSLPPPRPNSEPGAMAPPLPPARPDGPEQGSADFWFEGRKYEMPHGQVTDVIQHLWPLPGRASPERIVKKLLWTDKDKRIPETGLKSLRTAVNGFFCDHPAGRWNLPFRFRHESQLGRVRIERTREDAAAAEDSGD